MNKLQSAKIIILVDDYRQRSLKDFNETMESPAIVKLFESQGSAQLKLLIDKIKTDLLQLETKLEELL